MSSRFVCGHTGNCNYSSFGCYYISCLWIVARTDNKIRLELMINCNCVVCVWCSLTDLEYHICHPTQSNVTIDTQEVTER